MERQDILKRNYYVKRFFKERGYNVTLLGSIDAPKVMYKGWLLSCYVQNFQLHFTNRAFNGETVFSIKLREVQDDALNEQLNAWYHKSTHRRIFYICHEEPLFTLYVSGFDRSKSLDIEDSTLVCSTEKDSVKIYYSSKEATKIVEKYREKTGLNLIVKRYD